MKSNNKAFSNLLSAVDKIKNGTPSGGREDEGKYWKLEQDKAGNGFAQIRFLPGKTEDDLPFVKYYSHGFKGPTGKWFIENCPTTLGKPCPACESNGDLWNSGREADKEVARDRKRRTSFVSNILVVSDPKHPETEGKVFMFRYGQKIFDKITDAIQPEVFEGEDPREPVNPFDPEEGATFKLKIRRVEGYPNYDKSEFGQSESLGTKKEIDAILDQLHDINELVSEKSVKAYDVLKTKLDQVLNTSGGSTSKATDVKSIDEEDDEEFVTKVVEKSKETPKPAAKKVVEDDDEDEGLDFFKRLAEDD